MKFFKLNRLSDEPCEHVWKVIYTDDDECRLCGMIRYWPMASDQKHLWKEGEV